MSEDQRKAYVNEFNKMPIDDAMKGKAIRVNHVCTGEMSKCKEISLDVTTILKSFHPWTDGLVAIIVKSAETLLNTKDAVQPMPCMVADAKRKFLVAAKNCKRGMYECTVFDDHVNCSCHCYKYNNLCKHSICVAEIAGILKNIYNILRNLQDGVLHRKVDLLSHQKMPTERRVVATRTPTDLPGKSLTKLLARPFTEIHHNNKPFILCFLDATPNAKECRQCRIQFPRRQQITPFDIALSHQEKWLYPDPKDRGHKLPISTPHHQILLH